MSESVDSARKELDDEYAQVREHLGRIHVAFDAVLAAGPTDDLYELLSTLKDEVDNVRDGRLLGSGAKGHRKALERYRAAQSGG